MLHPCGPGKKLHQGKYRVQCPIFPAALVHRRSASGARDYKNVHTGVQALLELGLLEKDGRGGLRAPFEQDANAAARSRGLQAAGSVLEDCLGPGASRPGAQSSMRRFHSRSFAALPYRQIGL